MAPSTRNLTRARLVAWRKKKAISSGQWNLWFQLLLRFCGFTTDSHSIPTAMWNPKQSTLHFSTIQWFKAWIRTILRLSLVMDQLEMAKKTPCSLGGEFLEFLLAPCFTWITPRTPRFFLSKGACYTAEWHPGSNKPPNFPRHQLPRTACGLRFKQTPTKRKILDRAGWIHYNRVQLLLDLTQLKSFYLTISHQLTISNNIIRMHSGSYVHGRCFASHQWNRNANAVLQVSPSRIEKHHCSPLGNKIITTKLRVIILWFVTAKGFTSLHRSSMSSTGCQVLGTLSIGWKQQRWKATGRGNGISIDVLHGLPRCFSERGKSKKPKQNGYIQYTQ